MRGSGRLGATSRMALLGVAVLVAATVQPGPAAQASPAFQVGPAAQVAPEGAPGMLRVGQLLLRKCGAAPLAYCGRIAVPLDYSRKTSPDIGIGFRWLPATHAVRPQARCSRSRADPGSRRPGPSPSTSP